MNTSEDRVCPGCSRAIAARVFPAMFRAVQAISPADLALAEGEASCYHHAGKRAVTSCSQCGCFLCALCAVELNGATFCPACIQPGAGRKKIGNLENNRTLWDSIALAAAAGPIVFVIPMIYVWFVTGPLALFVAIRYWRAPSSIVPRYQWRMILAVVLSLVQLAGFVFLLFAIVLAFRANPNLLQPRGR